MIDNNDLDQFEGAEFPGRQLPNAFTSFPTIFLE